MKFKIRYADQIVGIFSIAALLGLMVLIFSIGVKQNWFVRKNVYYTQFESGSGIKPGMDINYKGFGIGKIKEITLENDKVLVEFYILDDYIDYVKEYSLLEFSSNILGLGTSFVWHPGKGQEIIEPGSEIFRFDSIEGQKIRYAGFSDTTNANDAISSILNKVEPLLDSLTVLLNDIDAGIKGQDFVDLDGNVQRNELAGIILNVKNITANLSDLTKEFAILGSSLNGDSGAVAALLGSEGWKSITDILGNVQVLIESFGGVGDQAGVLLSNSTPQLDSALGQLDTLLLQLQDVLEGVKNNPLIKNGVPDRSQQSAATPNLRSGEF